MGKRLSVRMASLIRIIQTREAESMNSASLFLFVADGFENELGRVNAGVSRVGLNQTRYYRSARCSD